MQKAKSHIPTGFHTVTASLIVRNGAEAVRWARQACEADSYRDAQLIDTLAAALAEAGQFDEAVKMSQRVIDMSAGQPKAAKSARQRLELYRLSKPYREK